MVDKPKRVAVIGLDCPLMPLLDQYMAEGLLPNIKKLIETGTIADHCVVPFPTITPPNWATIATGANAGTHQVTDFWLPIKGKTPDSTNILQSYTSENIKAEFGCEAADKAGLKTIFLNYPGSWPSRLKNGIVIGGAALTLIDNMNGVRAGNTTSVCSNTVLSTGFYPGAARSTFEPAEGWANLDEPGEEPLEFVAQLPFPAAQEPMAPTTWYALARQSGGEGYDTVTLSPSRDMKDAFCTLHVGDWSPKVWTTVKTAAGEEKKVFFRTKLVQLSDDADDFFMFVTTLCDLTTYAAPVEAAAKIDSPEGVPVSAVAMIEAMNGVIDWYTYTECAEMHTRFLEEAAVSLLKDGDWSMFFMHSHPTDFTYHLILTDMDPVTSKDAAKLELAKVVDRRVYQAQDRMIGEILKVLPEDTLVVLVSDHGAVADGEIFDPYNAFAAAGLVEITQQVTLKNAMEEFNYRMGQTPPQYNIKTAKALARGICYCHVHLKGRDPEGVVEPEDFEKVQQQMIDALYQYVDPKTGKRPVALALSKQDARLLGLYGENCGDVVYALYPSFGGQHGHILPTAKWGIGDLAGLFVLNGPGIKQGHRLARTVHLTDLVPTVCYAADLPVPATVDGAVIYQAFVDPNFKRNETIEINEALAQAEAALSGKGE
ncbi:MAG: alkaline phosphatase family protein [Chloroflexota bacterium]